MRKLKGNLLFDMKNLAISCDVKSGDPVVWTEVLSWKPPSLSKHYKMYIQWGIIQASEVSEKNIQWENLDLSVP